MDQKIRKLSKNSWPKRILEIPDPPKQLSIKGNLPDDDYKWICIVGSRKYSEYGKEVCEKIIEGLRGYKVVIVSGLALGIDSIAHKKALECGLFCVGVPGSGLNEKVLYPQINLKLAKKISQKGCLISEYEDNQVSTLWTFPKRNRIMVGLSHAVLIIEAKEKSGTLITARLATDYNRDVLTVPGSIFNKNSYGPNKLLKQGASPITCAEDILEILGIKFEEKKDASINLSLEESLIIKSINGETSFEELLEKTSFKINDLQRCLSNLEIKCLIKKIDGKFQVVK